MKQPFAWKIQSRREVLHDELAGLRDVPYSLWRDMIGTTLIKAVEGRDGKTYQVRVHAGWAGPASEDIRITATIRRPFWKSKDDVSGSFVITSGNAFID